MRIEDKAPIGSPPHAGTAAPEASRKRASAAPTRGGDTAEISQRARDIQKARDAIHSLPGVREERVAEIRSRLARGEYQVPTGDVADRMVEALAGEEPPAG